MRYGLFVATLDHFGGVGNDGEGRMGWMRCRLVGWAMSSLDLASRPRKQPPLQLPGLLTRIRWSDFTVRVVSSDTSGPSETAAQTLPSFKSKELARKKRLSSTLGRFAVPQILRSTNPKSFLRYQRVAYVYKAKKERQGSKVRVIWGYVFRLHLCYTSPIF